MRTLFLGVLLGTLAGCHAQVGDPLSPAEIYRRVAASSVMVSAGTEFGSGTVILDRGDTAVVLTAFHVIAHAERVLRIVRMSEDESGSPQMLSVLARVIAADPKRDLALVETRSALGAPALPLAGDDPEPYDPLFLVAAPLGVPGTAAPGVMGTHIVRVNDSELWALSGFVFFGSSGGTVANERAELVAVPVVVATWGRLPIAGLGYCVPLFVLREFLEQSPVAAALGL